MAAAVINGKAYDSADVDVNILGKDILEVIEVTYNTTREHQKNFGLASRARSWSMGKYEDTASITLPMKEVVAIESGIVGISRDLTTIKPFPIIVTYTEETGKVVTDIITAKFQSQGRTVNGEMGLNQQFELFVLDIKYNVA